MISESSAQVMRCLFEAAFIISLMSLNDTLHYFETSRQKYLKNRGRQGFARQVGLNINEPQPQGSGLNKPWIKPGAKYKNTHTLAHSIVSPISPTANF